MGGCNLDKPVRYFIVRLLFGFASDSVFDKLSQSTNSETAMLSSPDAHSNMSVRKNIILEKREKHS